MVKLKITVVSGPDFGSELRLENGSFRIGKDPTNDLVLKDTAVSRTHLLVAVDRGNVTVTDNQSTNGAYCSGMKFTSIEIKPGATIRIGRTVIKFVPQSAPAAVLPPSDQDHFGLLVGSSLRMRELFTLLARVAKSDADVLIRGETGTGKELCAESIHQASARAKAPFVVCDLAAVAPTLFESELFGHVKGSFTGAVANREGAFERASGGTVFLDEVGDLSAEIQPRLLRALERRQVKRVGSNDYVTVDVRVIAATHKDLEAEVKAGRFREDLYHRLAVAQVHLPSLRERPEDIPVLIDQILAKLGKEKSKLAPETRAILCDYAWPGNVRELRNVVERAIDLGDAALPAKGGASVPQPDSPPGSLSFKEAKERLVNAFEKDYLNELLRRCGGNISKAALEAGIDRVYVHRLIKKHKLKVKGEPAPEGDGD